MLKLHKKNIDLVKNLIIIFLLIIIIIFVLKNNTIQWEHKDAIEQYNILVKKYGKPTIYDFKKGGIAIWKKNKLMNTCFDYIELLDESVPHCVPKPHRDFLYTYVKYEIPEDKILDVTSLSGSIAYDPLKKTLRARCGSEAANIGTLYLATAIGNSRISIKKVQEKKLYKSVIVSLQNKQNVALYYKKLCKSLEEQPGNPEWSGYYPLAFPEGCCPGYDPNLNKCGKENFYEHTDKTDKFTAHTDKTDKFTAHTDKTDKNIDKPELEPVIV
tara:strand:- start:89 stop:901 length:813 start_codon:yes stop_codon:yes gene_type:complete